MADNITIEGIDEISEKLEGMISDAKVKKALGKACAIVERAAKQKASNLGGSGELRRSITSKIENVGGGSVGVVFTPLFYAPYVEYGTGLFAENGNGRKEVPWVYVKGGTQSNSSKKTVYPTKEDAEQAAAYLREEKGLDAVVTYGMHPHPFMRPALNENREEIKKILKEAIFKDD